MSNLKLPLEKYQRLITRECEAVKQLLIEKNREYGASAFHPICVFSQASAEEQINVRIDDKLKRIRAVTNMAEVKVHEDTEMDLIGYLILKRVARRLMEKQDLEKKCDG
jgi:hypothetical protein